MADGKLLGVPATPGSEGLADRVTPKTTPIAGGQFYKSGRHPALLIDSPALSAMCWRVSGLKRAGLALRYLTPTITTSRHGATMNRFQTWTTRTDRVPPLYKTTRHLGSGDQSSNSTYRDSQRHLLLSTRPGSMGWACRKCGLPEEVGDLGHRNLVYLKSNATCSSARLFARGGQCAHLRSAVHLSVPGGEKEGSVCPRSRAAIPRQPLAG